MKNYLLTWYGLTDLKAALGLEETDGPVLNALKTGEYTDVVVLAYTDQSKDPKGFSDAQLEEWEDWRTAPKGTVSAPSRDKVQDLLDAVANTPAGHAFFQQRLDWELEALGIAVDITVLPQRLGHLNDAEGIYAAASSAVKSALADPSEKTITTFVSPGTPVMAYTWALIARSNPQLRIGVISSSNPREPPERISLPSTLLSAHITPSADTINADHQRYDLVIHLLGEQTLPIYYGLRQFPAEKSLILTTSNYEAEARRIAKAAGIAPTPITIADAFRQEDTRKALAKQVQKLPSDAKVAINLTGGTKLMFAGALTACWELGLDPFYFEVNNHNVVFLRDGSQLPFVGISDVEDFLRAGDFTTVNEGRWIPGSPRDKRRDATPELWQRRDALRGLYKTWEFGHFMTRNDADHASFDFSWSGGKATRGVDGTSTLTLKDTDIAVPNEDFFTFLSGGWLEEYVYGLLLPLHEEGLVRDVRVGFVAGYRDGAASSGDKLAQEFDCMFTDGKRLWIVECKAGPVKQEAIQKLENNVRTYGGVAARGILTASFPLSGANANRLEGSHSLRALVGEDLTTENLRRIIQRA